MSNSLELRRRRQKFRVLEKLPPAVEVREEFHRTSRRLRLLVQLLGLCERAEGERSTAPSKSPTA
jgi:hypothetical protein